MPHPLLYEINTRCYLRSLSERMGKSATLADVPDSEFNRWQQLGFTHVWAMGIWTTRAHCRSLALDDARMRSKFDELVPGWKPDDVPGSPYAIGEYTVPPALGGETALASFRQKLNARGIKLMLDFVPNHFGKDHPWVANRPELFVNSATPAPGTFEQKTASGTRWIAHGKDPNFGPWVDTAQIDYRRPETRATMVEILQGIARRCDGVRCDMAMLELNDILAKTWANLPVDGPQPTTEFWADAIGGVKKKFPEFLFLAEAYWGTEPRLQSLGFNFTYNKLLHDKLRDRDYAGLQGGLISLPRDVMNQSAHFLENHDEPRAATILAPEQYRTAALLLLSLPGMRLIYEGQMEGRKLQIPVQLGRWPDEPVNNDVRALYEKLFAVLKDSAIGRGDWTMLTPTGWPDNQSAKNLVIIQWKKSAGAPASRPAEFDLVIVNLASARSQCLVKLAGAEIAAHDWMMRDLLGPERYERIGDELAEVGLFLDVLPNAAQVFRFTSA